MKDEFLNDNELDQWLRTNAGHQDTPPATDGWDTPSEAVWSGLRNGLDQRKKRRRILIFWSVLILALIGGGLWHWSARDVEQPTAVVANQQHSTVNTLNNAFPKATFKSPGENKQATKQETTHITDRQIQSPASDTRQVNTTTHRSPTPPASQTVTTDFIPTQPAPKNRQTVSQVAAGPDLPATQQIYGMNGYPAPAQLPVSTVPATLITPDISHRQVRSLQGLLAAFPPTFSTEPARTVAALPRAEATRKEVPPQVAASNSIPKDHGVNVYTGLHLGSYFTSRTLRNEQGTKPNGSEAGAWTWQQGIDLGLQLNKHWSLETGLQLSRIRLQAERTINFRYRTNQEQFNAQDFVYRNSDQQTIETSFGEVEMRMDIGREPSRPITDQAVVQLTLRTDEQVRYLRLPALVEWHFTRGPWQLGVRGGIGVNFENGYSLGLTAARSDRLGVRNIQARIQKRAAGLASVVIDAQFGAAVRYKLAPNWSLQLAPELYYGLNSMYQNGPFESIPITGGLQVGLTYHWAP
ncbi:MAG: hypothetical protein EP344_10365 [Bacteroidetes bacterium]|nr:MAG: hypothetical protein EP344_10365 [Bacteroidota bacterium]